jgi:hypothetical protein
VFVLFLAFLCSNGIVAQKVGDAIYNEIINEEHVAQCFQVLETQKERLIGSLQEFAANGEQGARNLPLGIKKTFGNVPFTLAINQVKFNDEYAELTVFLQMEVPQKYPPLRFAATNIRMSYTGNFIGDVQLSLLSNLPIPIKSLGEILLKGSYDFKTGKGTPGSA